MKRIYICKSQNHQRAIRRAHNDSRAFQKRRQQKIARNRAKRKRLLHRRQRVHGSIINPTPRSVYVVGQRQYRQQEILGYYAEQLGVTPRPLARYVQMGRREVQIPFPEQFSFLDAPDDVLGTLERIISATMNSRTGAIVVDQTACKEIDYGAEALATALLMSANQAYNVSLRGDFPKDLAAREIIVATGLPRELGADLPDVPPQYVRFPLFTGRATREVATKSTRRDQATYSFTRYIDDCLRHYGLGLTRLGMNYLATILGEVIDNAEQHSARDDWWIAGYLHTSQGGLYGDCHLTIFNLGRTIFESMQELDPESRLRKDMDEITNKHNRRSFWKRDYEEEQLWTLYALQAGVSRLNNDPEVMDTTRGNGLAKMITFFQVLGSTKDEDKKPRMCLVSGKAYILFDDRYQMEEKTLEHGEKRLIIAFNKGNDLYDRPDARNVRRLSRFFPGTLVSMRFYFDRNHLTQSTRGAPK